MLRSTATARAPRLAALLAATLAGAGGLAASAGATAVSSNWAGYVARPSAGQRFSTVSGTWTEPSATCTAGREAYSAVWVGLGGYRQSARALEQIGTDADCTSSGQARYSSWYELLPAGPVKLSVRIRPGDRVSASVNVQGRAVTLRVRNLTTGAHFSTTRRPAQLDRSSAEWIVEAPSLCASATRCRTLPLANFGDVSFASATAAAHGHSGAVANPHWTAGALELRQSLFAGGARPVAANSSATTINATPTALGAGGAFSVSWRQQAGQGGEPAAPALPAAGAG